MLTLLLLIGAGFVTTVDSQNNYYGVTTGPGMSLFASNNIHQIIKFTANGASFTRSLFAGASGTSELNRGYSDGCGTFSKFWTPYQLTIDSGNNVIVADSSNSLIRTISPSGL